MNLRDKLKEENIIVPIQASTQPDAIQELLLHLQKINILSATIKLFSNIENNERTVPCAAGRGIAYPHSTSVEIETIFFSLIDLNFPII